MIYLSNKKSAVHFVSHSLFILPSTTLAAILYLQQQISPYQQIFNHKFYDRKRAMDEIAKVANKNYTNRLSSNHKDQHFILIPGGSGIGKSRAGMESQHLISHAEELVLANLSSVEIGSVKAALNDPIYIFIDLINGSNYNEQIDKQAAKVRIGARVAMSAGLIDEISNNFLKFYSIDKVIHEILCRRFKEKNRPLEAVIIHIDEYQRYIDNVQQFKKISWEDARSFFKEMLQEIGAVMRNQVTRKQEGAGEYFIIPICTGTSAIDVHFLHTEYTKVLVQLKPLDSFSASMMFLDKYQYSKPTTESVKKRLKQNVEQYYGTSFDQSVICERSEELCKIVSAQEHFRIALFDTGFIPKFLDDLLSPEYITPQTDWGNNLFYTMALRSVEINQNNLCCWKSTKDICIIISFGITRQTVRRDFLLPSLTSIGDVERAGLIFLAVPTETHSNDEFIIVMPFMLMKMLNKMLLSTADLLFPDELLLIPTKERPWWWQDFECLHGYYQRALIKALINVRNARILALEQRIGQLQEVLKDIKGRDAYNIKEQIKMEKSYLASEKQKSWCLSDIFRGVKGDATLLQHQVKLCDLGVFTEQEKFLVKTTDTAQFSKSVLCDDNITRPLETAIFHCADECANIDHRWAVESADGKPLAIFMQDKHSKYDTVDPKVSGPTLLEWYNTTLQSVSSYANDYEIILIFFTVHRFTGSNLQEMPRLLLIDEDCIKDYLSPTFAHRGLVVPPTDHDTEQVLSYPIPEEELSYSMNIDV